MRDILTGFAILLLLALTAALAGPYFIDWEHRRDEISHHLSAATGQPMRVEGPISVTLLPTPALKLGQVHFLEGGAAIGQIGRIKVSAALPPLLRGQFRITEALVQGGRIVVDPAMPLAGFALNTPGTTTGLEISVEKLAVTGVDLVIKPMRGPEVMALRAIEGTLEMTALEGPFKGGFAFTTGPDADPERRLLRFSTGRVMGQSLRVRALSENERAAARVDYDGTMSWLGGVPGVEGKLSASGNAALALSEGLPNLPWRAQAQIKGSGARATADQVEIAFGHTDRQAVLTGVADVTLSPLPIVTATLASRQIDLDRLLAGEDNKRAPTPEALVRQLVALASQQGGVLPPVSGMLDLTVGSMLLNGGVIAAPRLALAVEEGRARLRRAEGEFPGRARLAFTGDGVLSAEVRDVPALLAWARGDAARTGPTGPGANVALRALAVEGVFATLPTGFRIRNGAIRADDMRFAGTVDADFSGPIPRVSADLTADQLDIARVPDFSEGDGHVGFDLDLALDARRVRYNGIGAGAIRARLSRIGQELRLGELTVRDLDGASMRAEGVIGGPAPRLTAEVQAQRLEALLELLDRLLPHPALPHLKARARVLAPAIFTLAATPTGSTGGADPRWRLTVAGKLGGTDVTGALVMTPDGRLQGAEALRLDVAAPLAGPLLRKLGLAAIDMPGSGPVRLTLAGGSTGAGGGAPWSLKGNLGGAALDVSGVLKPEDVEPFAGRISIDSADIAPLAQTLLIAVPQVQPGQGLRLKGGLDFRDYRLTIRDMDAVMGGVPVRGEISFNLLEFGRVAGQLKTPFFDAGAVAPLVFGQNPAPSEGWSVASFGPPAGVTLPGDLWIEADTARLTEGLLLDEPKFVLRFDNGLIFLEHARAKLAGAALTASGTLRRNGQAVSLAGRLAYSDARKFGGDSAGELEFTGLGDSPAQLVAGLNGGGVARYRRLELPIMPSTVFMDLAGAQERNETLTRNGLATRLKDSLATRLKVEAGETRLSLGSGVLRAGPLQLTDKANDITVGLALDLRSQTATGRMAFAARAVPKDWTGPPPQAVFTWRNPLRNPLASTVPEAEADEFANGLTALAIRRESERIDALEQDQRERGFFNRRLRAAEEERRAEAERRRQEEQRRLQAERERLQRQREEALRPVAPPLTILPPLTLPEPVVR